MNNVEILLEKLMAAKAAEDRAREERVALEEEVAGLVKTKPEGQETVQVGRYKVSIKRGFSYAIADMDALTRIPGVPIKTQTVLDETAVKKMKPAEFMAIREFLTVKPKKASITVKVEE